MRIIALVGADGTGKSTQAARLAARLAAMGYRTKKVRPVFLLFDPWRLRPGGHAGLSPRRLRLRRERGPGNGDSGRTKEAIVAAAGYIYALLSYAYLRAFLRGTEYVVCDRYFYQYFYDLAGSSADRLARAFPKPHIVFWLDAPPEVLRARIDIPPNGHEMTPYLDTVVGFYRGLAEDLPFVRIDATAGEQSVEEDIWKHLTKGAGSFAS